VAPRRRSSLFVQESEVVAGNVPGPAPPPAWASRLRKLIESSHHPEDGPPWFTPVDAYFGSVETRTDPQSYYWDGMERLGPRDLPHVYFQFTLAGYGNFELYGRPPQRILPGMGFFAVLPSRHRYYLPQGSPGWTFGWIGIYHPYLLRRITKQIALSGPVLQTPPASPLMASALRLVRGSFLKDFRDRFEVERALFDFTLAFERLAQHVCGPEGERLLESLRNRILAEPRVPVTVEDMAAEHGTSRSAFSHFFQSRTGLTPAHYVTEVRVQMAARMLTTTSLPLETIARECGFANANHFGKVFRRLRHQSAGTYRRTIR
jgi:AraC-like DNA-binding protein